MAAYTYFRIYITADQRITGGSNYYCNIAEVGLTTSGGAVSFVGATFSGTGNFSGTTYDPPKAFDGNNATCWSGDMNLLPTTPRWLQVQLAAPADVISFSLRSFSDTSGPKDFQLQGSNDGVSWTVLGDVKGETWAANTTKTYALSGGREKVTLIGADVLMIPPTNAKVTAISVEAMMIPPTNARVTLIQVEVLRSIDVITGSAGRRKMPFHIN